MLALDQVLPPSATVTSEGHLSVGGCDLVDLAEEHGTPLVVYDAGALRAMARAYREAVARHAPGGEVVYAHLGIVEDVDGLYQQIKDLLEKG